MKGKLLSRVRLIVTTWTAAHQAPPSMGFSRREYWSGVPLPSPGKSAKELLLQFLELGRLLFKGREEGSDQHFVMEVYED